MAQDDALLIVQDLVKAFSIRKGILQRAQSRVLAVDRVSFTIRAGETLGLVGESGCGKTTVARTILRLIPATDGRVFFDGQDVFALDRQALKRLRRDMQIIFQDPFSSLDPRMTIGQLVAEGLEIHHVGTPQERRERVVDILRQVQLRPEHVYRYPHEFSGGQRQRVGIARALVLRPRFVVCDEPVSTLDVPVQFQVLNLLAKLQAERGLTYLFITHDLRVVEHISDRVAVMYLGRIVELADVKELYQHPQHPYTRALMAAIPALGPRASRDRVTLTGEIPNPTSRPTGCRFHPRCPLALDRCTGQSPRFKDYGAGHYVACWRME